MKKGIYIFFNDFNVIGALETKDILKKRQLCDAQNKR